MTDEPPHSRLLEQFLSLIQADPPALDLACGAGRNGLFLLRHAVPVTFADRSPEALGKVREQLQEESMQDYQGLARLWQTDLEGSTPKPLPGEKFGTILVFRYLHRPLFTAIKEAVRPGGLVLYETFTTDQPRFGRPRNPDYLLRQGELQSTFRDWEILHAFEGVVERPDGAGSQAIAQLVARR